MEYSIEPKRLGERRIIHYPQKRIIGLYVNIGRRSRDLVEFISEERTKLKEDSPYRYTATQKGWKYSYGELIYNLYCSTRCNILTKEMVHTILASYTVTLHRLYKNYHSTERKVKDDAFEELKSVLGTSIAGRWSNSMLPKISYELATSVFDGIISNKYVTEFGSVNIRNLDTMFKIEVNQMIGFVDKKRSGQKIDLVDEQNIIDFLQSLESLGMFFTNVHVAGYLDESFSFRIEKDSTSGAIAEELVSGATNACFNVLNFVVNSFLWKIYFDGFHASLKKAVLKRYFSEIKESEFELNADYWKLNEILDDTFATYSMRNEYEEWVKVTGSFAVPIYNFDMVYNIIKRQADSRIYDNPESIDVKNMLRQCNKLYTDIGKQLGEQDKYYGITGENSFESNYSTCPFLKNVSIALGVEKHPEKKITLLYQWFTELMQVMVINEAIEIERRHI